MLGTLGLVCGVYLIAYHRPLLRLELLHPESQPGADREDPSHLGCFPRCGILKTAKYEPSLAGLWLALLLSGRLSTETLVFV